MDDFADPDGTYQLEDDIEPSTLDMTERAVLGGMLLSKAAIGDVLAVVSSADDFYQPRHGIVFDVIATLHGAGQPADAVTVTQALAASGDLARAGGAAYIAELIASTPTAASAGFYARSVREAAIRRRLAQFGVRAQALGAADDSGAPEDLVDASLEDLRKLRESITSLSGPRRLDDLVDAVLDAAEEAGKPDDGAPVVPTGIADLDRLFGGGLKPGQLCIVGARPGVGKSVFTTQAAADAAIKGGVPALLITLEMTQEEITQRIIAAQARVPLSRIRAGGLQAEDWGRIAAARAKLAGAPMWIEDDASLTADQVHALAKRHQREHGLGLLVVDYVQLLRAGKGRSESRQVEVSAMSRTLKLTAKDLGIPVVVAAQLNRGPEQRSGGRPVVSDLRESGSLEQDADIVVLLHREDMYEKESARAGEADLIVGKNRSGQTDTVTVAFQGHYSRFVDMATG